MRQQYRELDGLRAVAAFSIVCFHYCPPGGRLLNSALESGPAAVSFFFMLSGFVLSQSHSVVRDKWGFWRARLIRIYPMYLLAFVMFAPIAYEKYKHDPKTLLFSCAVNVSMLQAWTNLSQSWNGPSWSLSVEAFLYAMYPVLAPWILRRPTSIWWWVLAIAPGLLTIAVCIGWIPAAFWRAWIGNNPLLGLPVFCLGMALGFCRLKLHGSQGAADLKAAACIASLLVLALLWPQAYREVFITGGAVMPCGLLIVFCSYHSPIMERVLGNRVMVALGKASYIAYIVQAPLWHSFQAAQNVISHRPLGEIRVGVWQFFAFVPLLCVISLLLEKFVDEPIRMRLSGRHRRAPTVVVTAV